MAYFKMKQNCTMYRDVIIILLSVVMSIYGCAGSKQVRFSKGKHLKDKVQYGETKQVEFILIDAPYNINWNECRFRIKHIAHKEKLITPLFKEKKITDTKSWDPDIFEFILSIVWLPFAILANLFGDDFPPPGYKTHSTSVETGGVIEGKTKINGLVKTEPEYFSERVIRIKLNNERLNGLYKTDYEGQFFISSKIIANEYLMNKTVIVKIMDKDNTILVSKELSERYLKKVLNAAYKIVP